jgi:hypothetical protein
MGEWRAQQLRLAERVDAGPAGPRGGVAAAELLDVLQRCARDEAGGAEALRAWQGGRVPAMLKRILGGDQAKANQAFLRLVGDLAGEAGAVRGLDAARADDWLFAKVRLHARDAAGSPVPAPRLYAVGTTPPAVAAVPVAPPSAPAAAWPPPTPPGLAAAPTRTTAAVEPAPGVVNQRLRRPSAPVGGPTIGRGSDRSPYPGRRRRTLALLLWSAAGAAGFGLAILALAWLMAEGSRTAVEQRIAAPEPPRPPAAAVQPPAAAPGAAAPAPAAPPPVRPTAAPSVQELVGQPLADREPAVDALPPSPAPNVAAPPAAPAPPMSRLVVHHAAADREAAALARQLAEQLERAGLGAAEVAPVPFAIGTTSVRYFHAADRPDADRLVAAIRPLLAWNRRAAPSTPIDFTDFRPLPRPGTIEIWLPGR